MRTERVIEATGPSTEHTPRETVAVVLKPGSILVYGTPGTADALNQHLSRLGLRLTLTHRSICG